MSRAESELSERAAQIALQRSSDLLLYSHYAFEAFSDRRLADRQKGLFVFHPHHALTRDILLEDFEKYPECKWSVGMERDISDVTLRERLDSECVLADFLVCASSFTRRSLINFGMKPENIVVIPYGTHAGTYPSVNSTRDVSQARFLFVGQGLQRKGLHHLLLAWRAANIPNATLRLVCSRMDPGFSSLVDQPNVTISSAVSENELRELFSAAHVFVMPSLVEGFGLVYLEALAAGCYIVATANTGVPDLCLQASMFNQVSVGNIPELTNALISAHNLHCAKMIDHEAIMAFAKTLSWKTFRRRLVENLRLVSK
jgi:glycosyltransferase involved in cell wall biosynthesis